MQVVKSIECNVHARAFARPVVTEERSGDR